MNIAAEQEMTRRGSLLEVVDWQGWSSMLVVAVVAGGDFVQVVGGGPSVVGAVAYTECNGGVTDTFLLDTVRTDCRRGEGEWDDQRREGGSGGEKEWRIGGGGEEGEGSAGEGCGNQRGSITALHGKAMQAGYSSIVDGVGSSGVGEEAGRGQPVVGWKVGRMYGGGGGLRGFRAFFFFRLNGVGSVGQRWVTRGLVAAASRSGTLRAMTRRDIGASIAHTHACSVCWASGGNFGRGFGRRGLGGDFRRKNVGFVVAVLGRVAVLKETEKQWKGRETTEISISRNLPSTDD